MSLFNESGVKQVYYFGGKKHAVGPGDAIPDAHVTPDLVRIMRATTGPARRPGPTIRTAVPASNAPGVTVQVGARSAAARAGWLRTHATVRAPWPHEFPEPFRNLVSSSTTDSRWELLPEWDPVRSVPIELRPARLIADMRAVLRGQPVVGLKLLRGEAVPDPVGRVPLVVLCCHNAPRWETTALRGIFADTDAPPMDLVVIDDGSCASAATDLADEINFLCSGGAMRPTDGPGGTWYAAPCADVLPPGSRLVYRSHQRPEGYLRSANEGAAWFDPERHDMVVALNGDTDPGTGWLRALRRALHSGEKVGFANPITTNNVGQDVARPPGCTSSDLSDALFASFSGEYTEAFCPSGFCLAIRAEVWQAYGPYDEALWGTGYGEETHLECVAFDKGGWTSVHAGDAFVLHARSRSHGIVQAEEKSRSAFGKIKKLHGSWFSREHREFISRNPYRVEKDRAAAITRIPGPRASSGSVCFFAKTSKLSGGFLALSYLADAMARRGWDAHVATFDLQDVSLYDAHREFHVFDQEPDLRRSFRREVFPEGFLIAGSWTSVGTVDRVALDGGIVPVLFSQDDERRFEFNKGYGGQIEACWRAVPCVANSDWVAGAMEDVLGDRPPVIPVGIDPLVFFPRGRIVGSSPRLRVVAMARPSTAHRGTAHLMAALRLAQSRDLPIDVTFFGERPPSSDVRHTYAGRLTHPELAKLLADQDVLIDASHFQGFGMDAVQAMGCGIGLVCTDNLGASMYATHNETALVVPPGDTKAIADALERLCADCGLLQGIAGRGLDLVRSKYTWDLAAEQWSSYLSNLGAP